MLLPKAVVLEVQSLGEDSLPLAGEWDGGHRSGELGVHPKAVSLQL